MKAIKNDLGILGAMLIGGLLAFIIALMISFVCAYCITAGYLQQNTVSALLSPIILIAVYLACLLTVGKQPKEKRIIAALGVGVSYCLICFIGKLLFFPGGTQHMMQNLLTAILAVAAAAVTSIFVGKQKKRRAPKRRR